MTRTNPNRTIRIGSWGALLLFFSAAAWSQYPETAPKTGFHPSGTYAISDLESINTVNGNVNVRIPLTKLPAGRAGMTHSVDLVYNSAIYEIRPGFETWGQDRFLTQRLYPNPWSGWTYAYNFELDLEYRAFDSGNVCAETGGYLYKLRLILPDSSQHPLNLRGQFADASGFFQHDPLGTSPCVAAITGPLTYSTSDGSYIKVQVEDPPGNETLWTQRSWTVYLPDGTRLFRDAVNNKKVIYDRNGNSVEIERFAPPGQNPYTRVSQPLTPTVRRSITITNTFPGGIPVDVITQPGYAAQNLTWSVRWKTMIVGNVAPLPVYTCTDVSHTCTNFTIHTVLDRIDLPNITGATSYVFAYSDDTAAIKGWGELSKITLPTHKTSSEASVSYQYKEDGRALLRPLYALLENPVKRKEVRHDLVAVPDTWQYTFTTIGTGTNSQTTNPAGGVTTSWFYDPSLPTDPKRGLVYKIRKPNGDLIERVWATNRFYGPGTPSNDPGNPFVQVETTSLANPATNPAKTSTKKFDYDKNGNLLEQTEYDWVAYSGPYTGVPAGSTAIRTTKFNFFANTPAASAGAPVDNVNAYWHPSSPQVRNAMQRREVRAGGPTGTILGIAELVYDNSATTANITQEKRWDSLKAASPPGLGALSSANSVIATKQYDVNGNLTLHTDERNTRTRFTYGAISGVVNLYPTQTEEAEGVAGVEQTTTRVYDFSSGMVNSQTLVERTATGSFTYDALGRNTSVTEAGQRKTTTTYDDINLKVTVKSDLNTLNDGLLQAVTHYDQLGRVRLTRQTDGTALSPTSETDGIRTTRAYVTQQTGGGHEIVSNPYRLTSDLTMGWTCTKFDATGRVTNVGTFSGATAPSSCTSATNRTGLTTIAYDVDKTTTTDPASKIRDNFIDGLGRLKQVIEYPGTGSYTTTYGYDAHDNLTSVNQSGQSRGFTYTSLSRLRTATNPESGTTTYSYFDDGMLLSRADARGITATFGYDALDRLTSKTYSDFGAPNPTPWVAYTYGTTLNTCNYGRLTQVYANGESNNYNLYNCLGQVLSSFQVAAGNTYNFSYLYFLNDALKSITYPSGRVVTHTVDNAGRVLTALSGGVTYGTVAAVPSDYAPHGALKQIRFGNNLWEYRDYNSRLQVTDVRLGTASGGTDRLRLLYGYGTTNNNGNVQTQQTISPGFNRTQSYTYDGVNRLTGASESGGTWSQAYGYEQFGNRWVTSSLGLGTLSPLTPTSSAAFSTATNRLQGGLWLHDAAGNQTRDAVNQQMAYDAETRMFSFTDPAVPADNRTYVYDGDGRRVRKTTPGGQRTIYVYDAFGRLAAEYSDSPPGGSGGTKYLTSDHLGSTRAVSDAAGAVTAFYDFTPFGDRIGSGVGGRPATYGTDGGINQQFAGKERDAETGLDYFGARYFSGAQGRFTSADRYMPSADVKDPQNWNRYAYARSNPLRYVDPNGLDWSDLSEEQRRVFQQYASNYNLTNKTKLSTEQVYNTLNESQMATYESVTYAMEHTQLVDNQGNSMGNALQQVAGVSRIAGEVPGSSKGDEQFRVYADLKPGAVATFGRAQGFEPSSNKVMALFQVYHHGFPDSFRQIRGQGVTGMEAGVQPSYNRGNLRSDIDVDYRFGQAHLQPANSDVRAPGNYQKFIDRWPGLRNWWDK